MLHSIPRTTIQTVTRVGTVSSLLLGLAGCAGLQTSGNEQAAAVDNSNCVQVTRIDRTEVLDEQTILFHMQDERVLQNSLPQRCNGLSNHDAFSYRTSTTQLCTADVITVLQRIGPGDGIGFTPMGSCQLGAFKPVTQDDGE